MIVGCTKAHRLQLGSARRDRSRNKPALNAPICLYPIIVELVPMHRNLRYLILVDVVQTLRCSDDCSISEMRSKTPTVPTWECRSRMD
jgi:hypothetical protein